MNQTDPHLPDLVLSPQRDGDVLGEYRQRIHRDDVDSLDALVEVLDMPDARAIVRIREDGGDWRLVEHKPGPVTDSLVRISRADVTAREYSRGRAELTEGYLRAVLRNGHESIVVLDPETLRIQYASDHLLTLLNAPDEATVIGRRGLAFVDPRDRRQLLQSLGRLDKGENQRLQVETRLLVPDAEPIWMEATLSDARDDPDVNAIIVNLRDITDRKSAEERLRASEHLFRVLLLQLADGAVVLDQNEHITFVSERAAEAIGADPESLLGLPLPLNASSAQLTLGAAPADTQESTLSLLPAEAFNRSGRCFELIGHDLRNDPVVEGTVVVLRDITERRRRDERLRRAAELDSLTGLPNRRGFEAALCDHVQDGRRLIVAYLDLDGFKQVNDTLGHGLGDKLLQGVAQRLKAGVRPGDEVARFGGDEFVVAFVDSGTKPEALLERLVAAIEIPYDLDGIVVQPGVSAGWSHLKRGESVTAALHRADMAMYNDKRGRVA